MPREVIGNGEFSAGSAQCYTMAMLFYEFYMALSGTDRLQCVPFCTKHRTRVWASLAKSINQYILASRNQKFNLTCLITCRLVIWLSFYFAIRQMTFATGAQSLKRKWLHISSRLSISFTFFINCLISRYLVIYWKDVFLIALLDAMNGYTRR